MKRCLYAGTLSLLGEARNYLKRQGIELINNPYRRTLTEGDLRLLLKDFEAVLAGPEPYTESVLVSAQRLKVIARTGVGYDNVDLAAAARRRIWVTWTPIPELAYAMAEQTFALILSFVKHVPSLNTAIRDGKWERTRWSELIDDLYPLTLGLLGVGRIGSEVARRAKCFRMRVVYNDVIRMTELERELGIEYVSFDRLLAEADILSIHIPLTSETRGKINDDVIGRMKRGAIVVNTARGAIIDEKALAGALEQNKLGGALLDVLSEEPPSPNHVFHALGERIPNLIITPHVGVGRHTFMAMALTAAEDVVRVLRGEKPKYPLNMELLGGY